MNELRLRLSTIASLVPNGARVCDIGTDHGYLSIYLKTSGKASRVIAADINPLPLENARKNIKKSGVGDIELRLCDGLSGIKSQEIDVAIIAGIGGEVIAGIIERGIDVVGSKDKKLILQPTTSPEVLRKSLYKNGFFIEKEIPLLENNKIYSVMLVSFIGEAIEKPEFFYYVGEVSPKNTSGKLYIEKQFKRLKNCADALRNVENKSADHLYCKDLADNIENYLKNT